MNRRLEPTAKNARSGKRLPIQCSLVIANGVQVGEGWVIDLSMRGCLVEGSVVSKREIVCSCASAFLILIRPSVCRWPSFGGLGAVGSAWNL